MCAIVGFIGKDKETNCDLVRRTVASCVERNLRRGPHAWGIVGLTMGGRLTVLKRSGRVTDVPKGLAEFMGDCSAWILHLRWATHGDATAAINNHPHPVDGGWLVHNGRVEDSRHMAADYRLLQSGECDSELLGLLMERSEKRGRWGQMTEALDQAKAYSPNYPDQALAAMWKDQVAVAVSGKPMHLWSSSQGSVFATLPPVMNGSRFEPVPSGKGFTVSLRSREFKVRQLPAWHAVTGTDKNQEY